MDNWLENSPTCRTFYTIFITGRASLSGSIFVPKKSTSMKTNSMPAENSTKPPVATKMGNPLMKLQVRGALQQYQPVHMTRHVEILTDVCAIQDAWLADTEP